MTRFIGYLAVCLGVLGLSGAAAAADPAKVFTVIDHAHAFRVDVPLGWSANASEGRPSLEITHDGATIYAYRCGEAGQTIDQAYEELEVFYRGRPDMEIGTAKRQESDSGLAISNEGTNASGTRYFWVIVGRGKNVFCVGAQDPSGKGAGMQARAIADSIRPVTRSSE